MSILEVTSQVKEQQNKANGRWLQALIALLILAGATIMAILATGDLWPIGFILLAALPGFVVLHRYPFAVVILWLLLTPFIIATDGGILRRLYWVIHRLLPPLTIGVILLSHALRIRPRQLPRPALADLAALAYIFVTLLSILYLSNQVTTTIIYMFDHVVIPVCLYLLVRLLAPGERDLKLLIPVAAFTLITQSVIGILSWSAPYLLPDAWLGRVGLRTTGSLVSYSVFSATVAFCGLYLLHAANSLKLSRARHHTLVFLFMLAGFMIFLSFSRGSWLAGLLMLGGLFLIHRRAMLQLALVAVPLLLLLFGTGLLTAQAQFAQQRFFSEQSEESALSRLPVVYASLRMFEQKPLFGWGYENFDRFDYQFQRRVGNLINPDKDHASHNVYLSILAEQGLLGLILFLTPLAGALHATAKGWRRLPPDTFCGRKLVFSLWLLILFHIVVNNFSNMRIEYGQALWWITLALIITLVNAHQPQGKAADA